MKALPDKQMAALRALDEFLRAQVEQGRRHQQPTTAQIAWQMGLRHGDGARRHGNGAVKGSYSGRVAPALHLASTMRALERRDLVFSTGDPRASRSRAIWWLTARGRELLSIDR